MNRYNKIIMCAVLITALFLSSCFYVLAYGEKSDDFVYKAIFGGIAPPSYVVGQDSSQVLGEKKEFSYTADDNLSVGFFHFDEFGFDLTEPEGFMSMPLIVEPFYNFSAPYNKSGFLIAEKDLNLYDLAYIDSYCISIEFLCAVGLQDYTGINMQRIFPDAFKFRFADNTELKGGKFEVLESKELNRYMHTTEVGSSATEVPYDLKVFHVKYTFDSPFRLTDLDDTNLRLIYSFNWSGLPPHYIRTFCAISSFSVSYVTADNIDIYAELLDDEEMQKDLEEAEKEADEVQNKVDNIVDQLDVPKPPDGDVDDVLGGINIDSITIVGDFFGIDETESLFGRFVMSVSVSVLGVAFIGYVLHGKKG